MTFTARRVNRDYHKFRRERRTWVRVEVDQHYPPPHALVTAPNHPHSPATTATTQSSVPPGPTLLSSSAQSFGQFALPPSLPDRRGTNVSSEELLPWRLPFPVAPSSFHHLMAIMSENYWAQENFLRLLRVQSPWETNFHHGSERHL